MSKHEVKDYRITVTPEATRGGGRAKLLKDLKAVGFRLVDDTTDHVKGLIPTNKVEELAAVPWISLQLNEEFQLDPIETKVT